MKIVYKAAGEPAEIRDIENTLKTMQELIEGFIENVIYKPGIDMWCNEEHKFNGMRSNVVIRNGCCDDVICGPIIFCGYDGEGECISLTDQQAEEIIKELNKDKYIANYEDDIYGVPLLVMDIEME